MTKLDWAKAKEREALQENPPDPIYAWWWTPSRGGRCGDCGEPMPKGSRMAYNHVQRLAVCEICIDDRGEMPKASKAWRRRSR